MPTAARARSNATFIVWWLCATAAGFLLGGLAGWGAELAAADRTVSGDQLLPVGLVAGAGFAVALQCAVLARRVSWWPRWALCSAVGWIVSSASLVYLGALPGDSSRNLFSLVALAIAPALGLALGLAQAIALPGSMARRAGWFLVVCVAWLVSLPLGWISAIVVGFPLGMLVTRLADGFVGGLAGALVGVVAIGAAQGAITGWALARLTRS